MKIPYDDSPIIRPEITGRKQNQEQSSLSSFAKTVICLLLIVNIVLGVMVVNVYAQGNGPKEINEVTVNNTNQGSSLAFATSKAVLSMVCISAGTYTDSVGGVHTGSELTYFYNVSSRGAGTIFKDDKVAGSAYIITNYHVVSPDKNNIYVLLYGSQQPINATLVGFSAEYDIAVIKFVASDEYKASGAVACTLGDSSILSIGDLCVALGNPIAMGMAASIGNISVPYELVSVEGGGTARVIRTDAAINSGNSGGGLFDENGNLIGVVNAKISSDKVENIAFAIPINLAISIANNIIRNNGKLKKVSLGIENKIKSSKSVYNSKTGKTSIEYVITVNKISVGSRASSCGMAVDDEIVSVGYNDKTFKVNYLYAIEDNIFNIDAGDVLKFKVNRNVSGEMRVEELVFNIKEVDVGVIN